MQHRHKDTVQTQSAKALQLIQSKVHASFNINLYYYYRSSKTIASYHKTTHCNIPVAKNTFQNIFPHFFGLPTTLSTLLVSGKVVVATVFTDPISRAHLSSIRRVGGLRHWLGELPGFGPSRNPVKQYGGKRATVLFLTGFQQTE